MLRRLLFLTIFAVLSSTVGSSAEAVNAAQAIAQKFAEDAPAKPTRPGLDYEMDMLKRARAEQAAIKTAPPAKAEVLKPAPAATVTPAPMAQATPQAPASELTKPVTPPATPLVAVVPAVLTPQPPTPSIVPAVATPPTAAPAHAEIQAKAEAKPADVVPPTVVPNVTAPRATLLLALELGGAATKGSSPTYDPILCLADACFVSAGMKSDAVKLSKLDALKLKSTSEASPDSCKGKVGCVFRGVGVPAGAVLQVVELGSASHGPETARDVQLDKTCRMIETDLVCESPIASPDFRIWVVPEDLARTAGPQALEDAVADGLPEEDVARTTDK